MYYLLALFVGILVGYVATPSSKVSQDDADRHRGGVYDDTNETS